MTGFLGGDLSHRNKYKLLAAVVVIIGLIIGYVSVYNVGLTQQVVITQFGQIVGRPKTEPGLYVKLPFLQKANYLSKHIVNRWESDEIQVTTNDNESLCVETSLIWEVADPVRYFQEVANKDNVPVVLENTVRIVVRNSFGSHNLLEVTKEYDQSRESLTFRGNIIDRMSEMITPRLDEKGLRLLRLELKGRKNCGEIGK